MNTKTLTRTLLCVMLVAFVGGLASGKSKQTEMPVVKKAPAPERQGWDEFPLYGDVAKVTIKQNGVVKYIYYFNANGDVSKYEKYSSGKLDEGYTYRYDSAGNLIDYVKYDSSGELVERVTNRYDSAGNQIEEVWYDLFGELWWRYTYRYDSAGKLIEEEHYSFGKLVESRETYRYDSAGNQIEKVRYNSDGNVNWRYTYEIEYR